LGGYQEKFLTPKPKQIPKQHAPVDNSILQNILLVADRYKSVRPLPWETGFAARVLGTSSSSTWPFTEAPLRNSVIADHQFRLASAAALTTFTIVPPTCVSRTAFQRVKFLKYLPTQDGLRDRAVLKWRMLLESDLEATVVGQQVLQLVEALSPDGEIQDLLLNVFSSKKTATLVKRVAAMFRYICWSRGRVIFRPLLCHETVIYAYTMHLLKSNAAATSASSFRQALTFYRHLLGCHSAEEAINSTRIKGCCARQAKLKRPLKQARVFTVNKIRSLESLTMHAESDEDRCAAGFFTFCAISSSRNFDANRSEHLECETDTDGSMYIELGTLDHKTATTPAKQTTFLPLIAFAPALIRNESSNWGTEWFEARKRCGLEFGKDKPVLPALGLDGKFLQRAATSAECSEWLSELLKLSGTSNEHETTHSLKCTVLAWAALYGMPIEDRRILGHHSHPTMKSVLTYSRQALSGPMAMVYNMFTEILDGTFDPEAPKIRRIISGPQPKRKARRVEPQQEAATGNDDEYPWPTNTPGDGLPESEQSFPEESMILEIEHELHGEVEPAEDKGPLHPEAEDISSASDSSSDSSDLDSEDIPSTQFDDDMLEAAGVDLAVVDVGVDGYDTFQHTQSGTIHYREIENPVRLVCARVFTSSYFRIIDKLKFSWPICQQCRAKIGTVQAAT
jgi:hypothetical protein